MCYRYSNTEEEKEFRRALRLRYRDESPENNVYPFSFYHTNAFAHQALPIVTMEKPDDISYYNWGLIPSWVKTIQQAHDLRKMTPNAQSEGVFDKPSWKGSIMTKRCLIPATGFFEWHHRLGMKIPFFIMVKDDNFPDTDRSFCFGGLYSYCKLSDGSEFKTFTIITTPANEKMEFIHNTKKRMPFILPRENEQAWLNPNLNKGDLEALMQPLDNKLIRAFTISNRITQKGVDPNSLETIKPASYEGFEEWIA